jgi:hypothetical protein
MCHLKFYKQNLKWKTMRQCKKCLKIQNINCSCVPKLNIDPFTSKKHILFIPWPIWTDFTTLDVPCETLEKQIKSSKGNETILNIHKYLSLSIYDRHVYLNMLKPMWLCFHEHNLDILSHIPCPKMNSHQLDNNEPSFLFSFNIIF